MLKVSLRAWGKKRKGWWAGQSALKRICNTDVGQVLLRSYSPVITFLLAKTTPAPMFSDSFSMAGKAKNGEARCDV